MLDISTVYETGVGKCFQTKLTTANYEGKFLLDLTSLKLTSVY